MHKINERIDSNPIKHPLPRDPAGPVVYDSVWGNWAGTQAATVWRRYAPTTLDQLVAIVQAARTDGVPVRAVGSGWSYSDIAIPSLASPPIAPSGYLVETHGLCAAPVPFPNFRGALLVHVEAGIQLCQLNTALDGRGLALPTLGGSAGQTLAGAISTGTHGGDFGLYPIADMVRAIQLVGPDGAVYWIERGSDRITTADVIVAMFPHLAHGTITYDDRWFEAVLVSMGSMGIIYSMVLEVVPHFWLAQRVETSKWSQVRPRLASRDLFRTDDAAFPGTTFVEVVLTPNFAESDRHVPFSPFDSAPGDRSCLVTRRAPIPAPPPAPPPSCGFDPIGWFLAAMPQTNGLPDFTVLLATLATAVRTSAVSLPVVGPFVAPVGEGLAASLDALALTHPSLNDLLAGVASLATATGQTWILRELNKLLMTSASQRKDGVGKGFEIMTGNDGTGGSQKIDSIELFFDATTPAYLDAIDALLDTIQRTGVCAGYVSLRFTLGTRAALGMQQVVGSNCAVEVGLFPNLLHENDVIRALQALALDPRAGARLHWGQRNELMGAAAVAHAYPRLSDWRVVRAQLTGNGAVTTFDNAFTARCGLSGPLQPRVAIIGPGTISVPVVKHAGGAANATSVTAEFTIASADLAGPVTATWTTPTGTLTGERVQVTFRGLAPDAPSPQPLAVRVVDAYGTVATAATSVEFVDSEGTDPRLVHKILPDPNP
jgi:hypothetical protein